MWRASLVCVVSIEAMISLLSSYASSSAWASVLISSGVSSVGKRAVSPVMAKFVTIEAFFVAICLSFSSVVVVVSESYC